MFKLREFLPQYVHGNAEMVVLQSEVLCSCPPHEYLGISIRKRAGSQRHFIGEAYRNATGFRH
jgi:hypothetical protein